MKQDLEDALFLMPQHRAQFKKSRSQTLDDLIDDQRAAGKLSSSTFDFAMMGYRYHNLFQDALKQFLKKPLKPKLIEDLLQITFAALLTRRDEQESGLIFWSVELCKETFGPAVAPLVNAFCRHNQREKSQILKKAHDNPSLVLGPKLSKRWKHHPNLIKRNGLKLLNRPEPGIEGFNEALQWQRYPIDVLKQATFQAMNKASWDFCHLCLKLSKEHFDPSSPLSLLDACAAPGAKLICFELEFRKWNPSVSSFATETKFHRLERLRGNLLRWGLDRNIQTYLLAWGSQPNWPHGPHDLIFADLPCSGSGTISERPDLLFKDLAEEVKELSTLQRSILEDLIQQLKPGSLMFVSLCSIDAEEIDSISHYLKCDPCFDTRKETDWVFEDLVGWCFKKN